MRVNDERNDTGFVKTGLLRARRALQKRFEGQLKQAELFEFAGHRCEAIVRGVIAKLSN